MHGLFFKQHLFGGQQTLLNLSHEEISVTLIWHVDDTGHDFSFRVIHVPL
jgi:hypothetical protein